MATTAESNLMDWLRDAHAMEKQAETMLTAQAGRLKNYPELKARIEQHIEETRGQARMLERCLERRGESPSMLKDFAGRVTAMAQGLGGAVVTDEVVKGAMAGYTFEHMEIASYTVLTGAARAIGDTETAQVCEAILQEERAMAKWLGDHLPSITERYLALTETPGATAKR